MAARSKRQARSAWRAPTEDPGRADPTTALEDLDIAESSARLDAAQARSTSGRLVKIIAAIVVVVLLIYAAFLLTRSNPPPTSNIGNATILAEAEELRAEINTLYVKRNNLLAEKARLEIRLTTIRARIRELQKQLEEKP